MEAAATRMAVLPTSFSARMMQKFAALEVGAMLGWMSTRVLGQYDLLVIENEEAPLEEDGQDVVYYVAPNIAALEWRHGFPPDEFRLWIALHEVTHRAQFTGVAWLREHFLSLVDQSLNSVSTDPKAFGTAMSQIAAARREGRNPFAEGGIAVLVASPEQREVLDQIMGMMSLLEGHGDVTMDRAGSRAPQRDSSFSQRHQPSAVAGGAACQTDAPDDGHRSQDEPVCGRRAVHRSRGRSRRHGILRQSMGRPRMPAEHG